MEQVTRYNVGDLIKELERFDPNLPVVTMSRKDKRRLMKGVWGVEEGIYTLDDLVRVPEQIDVLILWQNLIRVPTYEWR
jgi:hypothetical protein